MPEGRGQEELPHIRGQEQRPRVPDCDGAGTAERSYPTSEVREGGQEELPHVPTPKARGQRPGTIPAGVGFQAGCWHNHPLPLCPASVRLPPLTSGLGAWGSSSRPLTLTSDAG